MVGFWHIQSKLPSFLFACFLFFLHFHETQMASTPVKRIQVVKQCAEVIVWKKKTIVVPCCSLY